MTAFGALLPVWSPCGKPPFLASGHCLPTKPWLKLIGMRRDATGRYLGLHAPDRKFAYRPISSKTGRELDLELAGHFTAVLSRRPATFGYGITIIQHELGATQDLGSGVGIGSDQHMPAGIGDG